MNKTEQISNTKIFIIGQLMVNLPVLLIMSSIVFLTNYYLQLKLNLSFLIGFIAGWVYWAYSVEKWIKWAFLNNVEKERIYKIGKSGLLIWNINGINRIENKLKSQK